MQTVRGVWLTLFDAFVELKSDTELWSGVFQIKINKQACAFLSDVLQNVKDELHHNGLFATLTPPTVEDRSQNTIQGV